MPNWSFNYLRLKEKDVEKKSFILNEAGNVDFGILLPMPESLHITSGSVTEVAIYYYISNRMEKSLEEVKSMEESSLITNMFSDNWLAEICKRMSEEGYIHQMFKTQTIDGRPDDTLCRSEKEAEDFAYEMGRIYVDNYKKYGATTWYDWACANWGTKWNASDTMTMTVEPPTQNEGSDVEPEDREKLEISFSTAWAPPTRWLEALAEKTEFVCDYFTEGGRAGRYLSDGNGNLIPTCYPFNYSFKDKLRSAEMEELRCSDYGEDFTSDEREYHLFDSNADAWQYLLKQKGYSGLTERRALNKRKKKQWEEGPMYIFECTGRILLGENPAE